MTALVWFRRDLRLADNPALAAACAEHGHILPVYVHEPDEEGVWAAGAASRWWLHHSLAALSAAFKQKGGSLHIRTGGTLDNLVAACRAADATAVYWNRCYEPALIERDKHIKAALRQQGIEAKSFNAALWVEPWQVATQQNGPYRVFTPFWRAVRPRLEPEEPLPVPAMRFAKARHDVTLKSLELLPRIHWDKGLRETWTPGEQGALEALELFADDALNGYARLRDLPARYGTSRLSPHLHFGEISPRQIHYILHRQSQGLAAKRRPDLEPFLRELGWREFAHHLLFHFPQTPTDNFNPGFANFRWAKPDEALLERWRHGRTGIPLVDAGMRELWHTGWMHNRVRMVVASFLTKNLRQHWHEGAKWFWDTLVDADLANNTLGWQWVAGCGADAAPYFRVFNPVSQAQKFDPQGDYLRRWLPELKDAPLPLLHEPWKDGSLLSRSGYPAPMVDLAQSRRDALGAYQAMRGRD
jgi:deoxyribodipyrimidine photo-lyase